MRCSASRRARGFTLLELLLVVGLFGVLLTIAIATFLNQRASSQDRSAQSSIRNVHTLVRSIAAENDDELPDDLVARLIVAEPSLHMRHDPDDGPTKSTGPEVISVLFDTSSREVFLAVLSMSGKCWYIRETVRFGAVYGMDEDGEANGCDAHAVGALDLPVQDSSFEHPVPVTP